MDNKHLHLHLHCLTPHHDRMTFFERVLNTLMATYFYFPNNVLGIGDEIELFKELSDNNPPLTEMISSISSFIISGELLMSFPRPLPPGVLFLPEMGNGNERRSIKFDSVFQNILQKNNKGVIVVSFGTLSDTHKMPENIKRAMFEGLSQFSDYSVIWKFDQNDWPQIANFPHIHTFSWIPQRDLIYSDRVKVLITHCGFNSVLESVKAGMPMVFCPLFVDQMANAVRAMRHGLGVMADVKAAGFTGEIFASKLRTVLEDKSYETRSKIFAASLADRMLTSNQLLAKRTENVAKFGRRFPTLQKALKLNEFQYFCLDFMSCLLLFLLLPVIIVVTK